MLKLAQTNGNSAARWTFIQKHPPTTPEFTDGLHASPRCRYYRLYHAWDNPEETGSGNCVVIFHAVSLCPQNANTRRTPQPRPLFEYGCKKCHTLDLILQIAASKGRRPVGGSGFCPFTVSVLYHCTYNSGKWELDLVVCTDGVPQSLRYEVNAPRNAKSRA